MVAKITRRSSAPPPIQWPEWRWWEALAVASSLTGWFVGLFLAITLLAGLAYGWSRLQNYSQQLGISPSQALGWVQTGLETTPLQTAGQKNFLLLGVDTLATRGNSPALTDTMMVGSLNLRTGQITLLSLPRDLWSPEYQTKINALYWYGQQQQPASPATLPTTVISTMIGQPIHHTLVVSLDQVSQIIDAVGGIDITVEHGFVDDQFPRPDVDVTIVTDPTLLYERVEFQTGPTTMDGATALKYIRSRKSTGEEGDDLARSHRQQQVIAALLTRLRSPQLWQQPDKLGQLYQLYLNNWAQTLPIPELIATAKTLWPLRTQIQLLPQQLSVWPDHPTGLIWHPPIAQTQQQWVYLLRDETQFQNQIKTWFNSPTLATPSATVSKSGATL
jgi:LCP family protein required for cell wall assembly